MKKGVQAPNCNINSSLGLQPAVPSIHTYLLIPTESPTGSASLENPRTDGNTVPIYDEVLCL